MEELARIGLDDSRELVILATLALGRWVLGSCGSLVCGTTAGLTSPSDEPQRVVNDERSLVGGALGAGICRRRTKEEGFEKVKVALVRISCFEPVLPLAFHSPGFCYDRQGGILGGSLQQAGCEGGSAKAGRLGRMGSWGAQVGDGAAGLALAPVRGQRSCLCRVLPGAGAR